VDEKFQSKLETLYFENKYQDLLQILKKRGYANLDLIQKSIYIECLARSAKGNHAKPLLNQLLLTSPDSVESLIAASSVYLSLGNMQKTQLYLSEALKIQPVSPRALFIKFNLLLYQRKHQEAEIIFKQLRNLSKQWRESLLLFMTGLELYKMKQKPGLIKKFYQEQAQFIKNHNKEKFKKYKANARLVNWAGKNNLFDIKSSQTRIEIPFCSNAANVRANTIPLILNGQTYTILLDTGNTTGWIVYSMELNETLKSRTGSEITVRAGTESVFLTGQYKLYKSIFLNQFNLINLWGIYLPKPRPDYPDANLNPTFLKGMVTTMDFVNSKLILRTKGQFEKDLSLVPAPNISRLPWTGSKFCYLPVRVNHNQALAIIETGAEDIAIRLEFAKNIQLPLTPHLKHLPSGEASAFHQTVAEIKVGNFSFYRSRSEVWPFSRFKHPITGLTPDIIIGPATFKDKYSLSFDPFENQIIIIQEIHR